MFLACVMATSRQAGTENVERGIRAGAIGTIIAALQPQETAAPLMSKTVDLAAEPYAFTLSPGHCALLIIDMQRDFLEPGGFGEMLGNDVSQLRRTIEPNRRLLAAWRAAGLPALHTREGHRPDLSDLPPAKKVRGRSATTIGAVFVMGTPYVSKRTSDLKTSPTLPGVTVRTKPERNVRKLSIFFTPRMSRRDR